MNKKITMSEIFGEKKTREEVMREIEKNRVVYPLFLEMKESFREQYIQFCMGVRGVKMTYDSFFKYIFDAEIHPERLSRMLSQIIGRPLRVKRMLPTEHRRISEKGSLLVLDIIVEFETGELADVEIQKVGYYFPGQRMSCYSSDMVMRQYERQRSTRGEAFTYRDMTKVYTIVLMEKSVKELEGMKGVYLHRGGCAFDSGLQLEFLQEFYLIALDNFFEIEDNKDDTKTMSELEAWLYFIGSDKPEHILRVVEQYPWFAELYKEIAHFRQHPEEAITMFSDALRKLDENTVNFMIDEMKEELEESHKELAKSNEKLGEKTLEAEKISQELAETDKKLAETDKKLGEKTLEAEKISQELAETDKKLAETDKKLGEKTLEAEKISQELAETDKKLAETDKKLAEKTLEVEELSRRLDEKYRELERKRIENEELRKLLGERQY